MSEGAEKASGDGGNTIEYITSNFSLHQFNAAINDRKIIYQVLKMSDSVLVFINDKRNMQLSSMFVSLLNRYDNLPIGTRLFGDFMEEDVSKSMALRMSKKLNKTVYISCNVGEDRTLLPLVEKRIYEEVKAKPEVF